MKQKICSTCKKKYPANINYFTTTPRTKDGFYGICRFCKRKKDKVYSREYRRKNPKWKREDNKKNAISRNELIKKYHQKYPERGKAQYLLKRAILKEEIKREPCIVCESPKVHGHHEDYSKPLEVIWLCSIHHKAIHNSRSLLN